ncbi:hypothetical protein [Alteromonas sp. a30]|uniref:hypothetical protein n=1 Tax=Alteromonas sp. a30 TaxID=2730917 RepID=UPI002280A509|nr:hypothetical protein [Alteromonas sp. a30]MCY7297295.1 hypothetical protein [Alteromonas sp. a30]
MQSKIKNVVFVATREELESQSYYRRLWIATRNVKIPRRSWLDAIANTMRDFDGLIITRAGEVYNIPDIDAVFGDDPDLRWLGYYMQPDGSGEFPKMRTRKYQRLELLDLYFRINHPSIARHFGV